MVASIRRANRGEGARLCPNSNLTTSRRLLKRTPPSAPPSPKTPTPFELDAQWFREAKPLKEVLPELYEQWYGKPADQDSPPLQNSECPSPSRSVRGREQAHRRSQGMPESQSKNHC